MPRAVIGHEIIMEALSGHVERLSTADGISNALIELDTSPDEVGSALGALVDVRNIERDIKRQIYLAAALDGFVIGLRAARIAEQRKEQ